MNNKKTLILIGSLILASGLFLAGKFYWQNLRGIAPAIYPASRNLSENPLNLPSGFSVSVYADNLINPRVMIFDPNKNIITSITSQGKIILIPDKLNSKLNQPITLIDGLTEPHGLAFKCGVGCKLYVAETNSVSVYDYDIQNLTATNRKKLLDLSGGGNHFTRSLLITTINGQEKLLISIGSDCNVCNETDQQRAKILSANLDGSDLKVFSSGLRNSVFMTLNPINGQIWATEMGRDLLGDNIPPDEINIIRENANYGWPICYGKNIHDTEFDKNTYFRNPCMEPFEIPSYIDIPAHSAPLGLAFIPDKLNWPQEYKNNLFVAFHGSWNRSVPTGYKIVRYQLDNKGNIVNEIPHDFITGWLKNNSSAIGRPVGILFDETRGMFISDDKAGIIYLVTYK